MMLTRHWLQDNKITELSLKLLLRIHMRRKVKLGSSGEALFNRKYICRGHLTRLPRLTKEGKAFLLKANRAGVPYVARALLTHPVK